MNTKSQTNIPNSLEEHWMPFTANQDYKENPRLMTNASGMYYTDHYGNKIIEKNDDKQVKDVAQTEVSSDKDLSNTA